MADAASEAISLFDGGVGVLGAGEPDVLCEALGLAAGSLPSLEQAPRATTTSAAVATPVTPRARVMTEILLPPPDLLAQGANDALPTDRRGRRTRIVRHIWDSDLGCFSRLVARLKCRSGVGV